MHNSACAKVKSVSPYGMGSNVCHLTVALLLHIISCTDKSKEEVLLSSYLMAPPIAIVDIIYSMLFFLYGRFPFPFVEISQIDLEVQTEYT